MELLRLLGWLPLGLTVERMVDMPHFAEVAQLRRRAYGKRYPHFVQPDAPDAWDRAPSTVVLMVRCGARLVGTMRVRHSFAGREAGAFEPDAFPDTLFDEGRFLTIERFGIDAERSRRRLVRLVLFATVLRLATAWGADFLTLFTREELEPVYRRIGFERGGRTLCSALTNHVPQHFMRVAVNELPGRIRLPLAALMVRVLTRELDLDALRPANLGGRSFHFASELSADATRWSRGERALQPG
jgi:hypothetical protein